jgi:hypothetical protein
MAVWFMRWLRCADTIQTPNGIALTIGEEFTLFRAGIATDAGRVKTPTNDRRGNVLHTREHAHALSHGGAID